MTGLEGACEPLLWQSDEEAGIAVPSRVASTTASSDDDSHSEGSGKQPGTGGPCCHRAALPPRLSGLPAPDALRPPGSGGSDAAPTWPVERQCRPVLQGPMEGNVECTGLECHLGCSDQRPVRALQAALFVEALRYAGRWKYPLSTKGMGTFCIACLGKGTELAFKKDNWSGRPVEGALIPTGCWLQACLRFADDGEDHGAVRLRIDRRQGAMLLNFRRHGQAEWGPDAVARKVAAMCPEGHLLQACERIEARRCSWCLRPARNSGAVAACKACDFVLCPLCWELEVPAEFPSMFAVEAWGLAGQLFSKHNHERLCEMECSLVEVDVGEECCLVKRRALCAEELLSEVLGCCFTRFTEYRQHSVPFSHSLPSLRLPFHSFLVLELDGGAWHLCVERAAGRLCLTLGRGPPARLYAAAFDARGAPRCSAARPVLLHAQGGLGPPAGPRLRAAALLAWLPGLRAAPAALLALLQGAAQGLEGPEGPEGHEAERAAALAAVRREGALLERCPPRLRADPALVAAAVAQSGAALRFAAPALRADPELALDAVRGDSRALRYVAPALFRDHDFLLAAACSRHTRAMLVLALAPREVRLDRSFMCTVIRREPQLLRLAGREAALAAVLEAWRARLPRRSLSRAPR